MLCRGLPGRSSEASPTTFLVMAIGPFCWCGASLQPAKPNPATRHWLPTPECSVSIAERISDLLRPEAFNQPAQDLRLIETHISWVILAGDYAYKLRKAVNFGFLDFSTPEQRRADCEAEVRLNRRLCPDLYIGIVGIVERCGRLFADDVGEPVETAVQMRRLPDSGMLPALIERGAVDARLMHRLANELADFHACAATGGRRGRVRNPRRSSR
jgi:aminoglycoside phosphotransferase family enzyme